MKKIISILIATILLAVCFANAPKARADWQHWHEGADYVDHTNVEEYICVNNPQPGEEAIWEDVWLNTAFDCPDCMDMNIFGASGNGGQTAAGHINEEWRWYYTPGVDDMSSVKSAYTIELHAQWYVSTGFGDSEFIDQYGGSTVAGNGLDGSNANMAAFEQANVTGPITDSTGTYLDLNFATPFNDTVDADPDDINDPMDPSSWDMTIWADSFAPDADSAPYF